MMLLDLIMLAAEETAKTTTAAPEVPWYYNPGFIALVGTLFGGAGLKVLEKLLSRKTEKQSERRDLNAEIKDLLERVDKLEDEVTQWRTLYYHEQEQVALLRVMVIQLGGQLPETTLNRIAPQPPEASE